MIVLIVIIGYVVNNYKQLMEGFSDEENSDKNNISGHIAGNYSFGKNPEAVYRFNHRYKLSFPFYLDDRGTHIPSDKQITVSEPKFNSEGEQKKIQVIFC